MSQLLLQVAELGTPRIALVDRWWGDEGKEVHFAHFVVAVAVVAVVVVAVVVVAVIVVIIIVVV